VSHSEAPRKASAIDGAASASVAPVFAAVHGIDPMAPLRGRYRSARGILRHMRKFGGFAEMVETMMAAAGLSPA